MDPLRPLVACASQQCKGRLEVLFGVVISATYAEQISQVTQINAFLCTVSDLAELMDDGLKTGLGLVEPTHAREQIA